ncbi:response regulator [Deinococcus pimensis]|uniref:response regulator n=1 Tax=Deinococcus pimensis TaxID=309888 RepID=UPI0004843A8B|nr:response regulator [Deinococcus pimensis]
MNSRSTILLINAEGERARTAAAYLRLAGCDVQTATSALHALTQLERLLPDAIVCDAQLEDMSGMELLEIVRSEAQYADVVFLLVGAPEDDRFGLRDLALPERTDGPGILNELRLVLDLDGASDVNASGPVEPLGIDTVLSALAQGRRSGRLRLSLISSDVDLWLSAGQVVHARFGLELGERALHAIVTGARTVLNADYDFQSGDVSDVPRTIASGAVRL